MASKQETPVDGEVMESKAITVERTGANAVMVEGQKFDIVRRVNVPTLKQESGETVCFQIIQPLEEKVNYEKKTVKVDGVDREVTEEKTITIARVIPVGMTEEFEYVCNAMTADNIASAYPNNGYVGKYFAVRKGGVVAGKRYKSVEVVEIQPAA